MNYQPRSWKKLSRDERAEWVAELYTEDEYFGWIKKEDIIRNLREMLRQRKNKNAELQAYHSFAPDIAE